eukprot:gene37855-biopygen30005
MYPTHPSRYALCVPYTDPTTNAPRILTRDALIPNSSRKLRKPRLHCLAGYANDPLDDESKDNLKIDLLHHPNEPPTIVLTLLRGVLPNEELFLPYRGDF